MTTTINLLQSLKARTGAVSSPAPIVAPKSPQPTPEQVVALDAADETAPLPVWASAAVDPRKPLGINPPESLLPPAPFLPPVALKEPALLTIQEPKKRGRPKTKELGTAVYEIVAEDVDPFEKAIANAVVADERDKRIGALVVELFGLLVTK